MIARDARIREAISSGRTAWKSGQRSCMAERKVKRLLGASEITHAFRQLGFREFRTQGKPQAIKDAFECAKEYVADYEQIKESRKTALPF